MEQRAPRLVSIVVPTYNERQNLSRLVAAIAERVPPPYEIVVVDDGSPDGTADLARDLAKAHPLRLLSRGSKMGLGSAYRDGFAAAKGDIIFEMDADLSHDPADVQRLVAAVASGADVVVGSRYIAGGSVVGWGAYRRLVSGVGNGFARAALRLGVRDLTSGYRCYTREAVGVVSQAASDGYAFQVETLHLARRHGLRIVEVPIRFQNRAVGRSKLGAGEFARFVRTVGRLSLSRAPARSPPRPA